MDTLLGNKHLANWMGAWNHLERQVQDTCTRNLFVLAFWPCTVSQLLTAMSLQPDDFLVTRSFLMQNVFTLKCIRKCSAPVLSLRRVDLLASQRSCESYTVSAHAIGRALAHLLDVGSPKARILLSLPSTSLTRESALILSTARLNCRVLLSGEKISV